MRFSGEGRYGVFTTVGDISQSENMVSPLAHQSKCVSLVGREEVVFEEFATVMNRFASDVQGAHTIQDRLDNGREVRDNDEQLSHY